MQSDHYTLFGFKCFNTVHINLNKLTLLTGSNGTGKSSFIQALLLVRIALEKNAQDSKTHDLTGANWKEMPVPLNDLYELKLGTVYDIFNSNENYSKAGVHLNDDHFDFLFPDSNEQDDAIKIRNTSKSDNNGISFLRKREFYYLNTERLGPRLGVDAFHTDFIHCGYKGELTGQVIFKYGLSEKIIDARQHETIKSPFLQQQVDAWLGEICPGTKGVIVKQQGVGRYQITLRASASRQDILAPNIGFGISYALPIIVQGLIAKPGCMFIVENPEAHLHPLGQSNIGFFLGMVAAAGIKVIIETHSEHVVNGIRRASLMNRGMSPLELSIYFFGFNSEDHAVTTILQNEKGELSAFPKNFFDQVNQDMSAMFKLKVRK